MGLEMTSRARTCVFEGADLRTPYAVMDEAVVAGAVIGPRAYISDRAVVGLRSTIEGSVVYEDARIGARCRIIDSIIDSAVTVPDGSEVVSKIVSNARPEKHA